MTTATMIRNKVEECLDINLTRPSKDKNSKFKYYRGREYIYGRAIYFGLCREMTGMSYQDIGDTMGFNHATVLNLVKNVYANFEVWGEDRYIETIQTVRKEVKTPDGIRKEYDRLVSKQAYILSELKHGNIAHVIDLLENTLENA